MDHKLARICWNTRHWQRPSGPQGKTKHADSYEFLNGYGHEEWLFDIDKAIDGYHYGYVQAVGAHHERYIGMTFDLSLYSIDSETRKRWWIGTIKGVEVVDSAESATVYQTYLQNGWLEQMKAQVREVDGNVKAFEKFMSPENFAVIKYKIINLRLLDEPLEFDHRDVAVKSDYYNLKSYVGEPRFTTSLDDDFSPGHTPRKTGKRAAYSLQEIELSALHNQIQSGLQASLAGKYDGMVRTEYRLNGGGSVDIAVKDKHTGRFALYEIKTAISLSLCVREALGQLLEYRHRFGAVKVSKVVIVSVHPTNDEIESYLATLRKAHAIPVYYEQWEV